MGRRREAVQDLIRDNHGEVVFLCKMAEMSAERYELTGTGRKGRTLLTLYCIDIITVHVAAVKLGAEIGCNRVDDYEADVVSLNGYWDLKL